MEARAIAIISFALGQRPLTRQLALLEAQRFLRRLQFRLALAVRLLEGLEILTHAVELRLRLAQRDLIGLRVDAQEKLAGRHRLVLDDVHLDDVA